MRWYWKATIALAFVGMVAMAAAAFGQTGSSSPTPTASASAQQQGKLGRVGRLGNRVVHGDLKIKTPNGFANVKVDSGSVTSVDAKAFTITISRPDGQTVSVTGTDKTRVRKQGQKSTFGDIAKGDIVQIIQIDRGDGFVVALIRDRGPAGAANGQTSDESPAAAGVL